jgi:hypothetical protein
VINTSRSGEAPLSRENFPITKYARSATMIPVITPVIIAERSTIKIPIPSYFGGPSVSSRERLSMLSFIGDIEEYDEKSSYRDKYIRKIQNSKIFHCDEVDYMSDKYTLIGMRYGSCEDEDISSIEDYRVLSIFFSDIVIDESKDEDDREELKWESCDREREGYSWVIWEPKSEIFSDDRRICILIHHTIEIFSCAVIYKAGSLQSIIIIFSYIWGSHIAIIIVSKLVHIYLTHEVDKDEK